MIHFWLEILGSMHENFHKDNAHECLFNAYCAILVVNDVGNYPTQEPEEGPSQIADCVLCTVVFTSYAIPLSHASTPANPKVIPSSNTY